MKKRIVVGGVVAAALIVTGFAGSALADPRGVWLTKSGKSHVKIARCEKNRRELCGHIVWLRRPLGDDGKPRKDVHNDDKSLRKRPLIGIQVIFDMENEGGGEWDDGEIYNAEDGDTYSAEMEVIDKDTLEVSGCVFIICKSQTWKRVK